MEKRTTRSHYRIIGDNLIPKKPFDTEKEALNVARYLNTQPNIIHKMIAYKCSKCNKWHVGSNGNLLKDEDRERIKEKLKKGY